MALGEKTIEIIDGKLQTSLKDELRAQGHYLTGSLEDSVASQLGSKGDGVVLEIEANDYLGGRPEDQSGPLNTGVPPENIPYDSSRTTGAKHSKYIEGLKNFARLRFGIADEKEATSAAFAIAKKHEKEGMPTQGSYGFSQNGRRTMAMENTLSANEREMDQTIEDGISREIDEHLDADFDVKII